MQASSMNFAQWSRHCTAAGIEVILDVVYNHTCEGDHTGPIYSFKGIDSSTAYMMTGDPAAPYANYSGTGNTLHTANRAIRRHIVDSLRFWESKCTLTDFALIWLGLYSQLRWFDQSGRPTHHQRDRHERCTDQQSFDCRTLGCRWRISTRPEISRPAMDAVERPLSRHATAVCSWRHGLVGDLMTRLYGSSDLFPDDRMNALQPLRASTTSLRTTASRCTIWFLTTKNATGPMDTTTPTEQTTPAGTAAGKATKSALPEVSQLRKQQVKNFFCLLMLSNGTPMFRMGDEFMQTQGGNNNPYNQDNETSWLDWDRLNENNDIFRFFKQMIAFRKAHPSISRSRFWRDDIKWYGTNHLVDMSPTSQQLAFCLHGASQDDTDLYVMINASRRSHRIRSPRRSPRHLAPSRRHIPPQPA